MKEIWKDIKEYEGLYQVSNFGRVKSFPKPQQGYREIIMKQTKDKGGYMNVVLHKKGKAKQFFVHRLVANAFIDKKYFKSMPYEKREEIDLKKLHINHKNEFEKENNYVDNLEWCTRAYNNNYGTRNKRAKEKICVKIGKYDKSGNLLEIYNSVLEAKRNNSKSAGTHISEVCNGKRKSAYGYIWKYL